MKTPPSHPPRPSLLCRLARWSATATSLGARHLDDCPECHAWATRAAEFDRLLARDAKIVKSAPAPDGLEQLVMAGIARRSTRGARAHRSTRPWLWSIALVGTAACAALFVMRIPSPDTPRVAAEELELRPEELAQVVASVAALPGEIGARVVPPAARLAQDNPLLSEIDSVRSDARSALAFLALNFLPGTGSGTNGASDGRQG
jgi:hypothetical protein